MKFILGLMFILGLVFAASSSSLEIQYIDEEYCTQEKQGLYSEDIQYNSLTDSYNKTLICKNIK